MGTLGKEISGFTWRLVPPKRPEACRWESADGRWVSLTMPREPEIVRVVVSDSSGRHEAVDTYERALALAASWRT